MSIRDEIIAELQSNGFISEEAPLTPGVNLLITALGGVMLGKSDRALIMSRCHANLSGGGTITYDANKRLKWSERMILISIGNGDHFSTKGFFDITCPPSGTLIPGYAGAYDVQANTDGILMNPWTALYYEIPFGTSSGPLNSNWRILKFNDAFEVPDNWLLIGTQNNDPGYQLRLTCGVNLAPGQKWDIVNGVQSI